MKFKKVSQGEHACIYALVEDISSVEYAELVNWLNVHCPNAYELVNTHLFIEHKSSLFFDLTFDLGQM